MSGCGPYETGEEAYRDAEPVYRAMHAGAGPGAMARENEARLLAVLDAAGVQLGEYDRRIVHWLAGWEPETVQVVIGLVARAAQSSGTR